jgi:hypothetical protein
MIKEALVQQIMCGQYDRENGSGSECPHDVFLKFNNSRAILSESTQVFRLDFQVLTL